ncbi:hypothetical protein OHA72_29485 [Dactylosporangium sp. NBC_01737]|uniref:HAD domain-containing protein n=1 Tax=Dactylosporangium sp. NBC_01737 TaxID=2975959 RepID=UPI002E10A555|nr:hypothetical protein OHA72_29485 [Dactylosporangium sp. NBC_01737]
MACVWLLDVDGVINARKPGWHAAPHHGRAYAAGTAWPMRWAPALTARIRRLHNSGAVEVRWCSTWCAWSDQLERLFRLPPLPCAFTTTADAPAAKLAAARAVLAAGDHLIWTDDDEVPTAGPLLDELTAAGRALLIRPDARRGLTPDHLDEIEAFANLAAVPPASS